MLDCSEFIIQKKDEEHGCGVAVHIVCDILGLEGTVCYQALQVVKRDPLHAEVALHVEAALQWHKVDVPEVKTIIAGEHLIWNGLLALDVFQEALEFELGHLKERNKVLMQMQAHGLETREV